ncbi:unnamed protein product, partial [marine sediment metagenome]
TEEILLQCLSYIVHLCKPPSGKHDGLDPSGRTFFDCLGIRMGREDDYSKVDPLGKFLDRAMYFHSQDLTLLGIDQIELSRIFISENVSDNIVSRFVGLGNKVDVEESEVLEYYAGDPETKAILIYLEAFKRPKRFLEIASEVTRVKPVILLKGGSTAEGAQAAVAHTAALASDDRIIDGALKKAGITRIYKYSHLFLAAKALAAMPLPRGNRVSFMAPSGAMLVILSDLCHRDLGLRVPDIEEHDIAHGVSSKVTSLGNV